MTKLNPITTKAFHSGDTVMVLTGDDRGKKGRVVQMLPKTNRAIVDAVNVVTKHAKPTRSAPQGGRIEKPAPVHVSNLQLICPSCSKPTKAVIKVNGTERDRTCRLCHESLARKEQA